MHITHNRSKLLGSLVVVTVVAAFALAGCGGGSSSTESTGAIQLVTSTGKARHDIDKLTWALPEGEPLSLDPTLGGFYSSGLVAANICEPFERLRPDTSSSPHLGSLKRPSPTEYVFDLKKGIDFWDGREATGEDLLFSFEWAARPESYGAPAYENVASMTQTGPYQVTVKLKQPDALYERELGTDLGTALIEKEFTEKAGKEFGTPQGGVMCTGPFELTKWEPGQKIVLTRNENYWNPAEKAHAKTVELSFLSDSTALIQALSSGEVDGAYGLPPVTLPKLSKTASGKLYYGESQEFESLMVATPTSQLNDPKLLKALSLSIDRPAIAKAIYYEAAVPNYTFIGKNSWPPNAVAPWKAAYAKHEEEQKYDPTAAKKLVEESSYDGKPLVIAYLAGEQTGAQLGQLIQQEAGKIGIDIKLEPLQATQFQTATYDASARKGTDLELYRSFNILKEPLEPMLIYFQPGSLLNYTEYDNGKVAHLLIEGRETLNPMKRSELVTEIQEIYEEKPTAITMVTPYSASFLNSELTGATISGNWVWTPSLASIGAR